MPTGEMPDQSHDLGHADDATPSPLSKPAHAAHDPSAAAGPKPATTPKPAAPKPGAPRGRVIRIVASALVVLAIVVGYVSLLRYYENEADSRSTAVEVGNAEGDVGLSVSAWLVSVDQQQEQAVIRLNFEPKGSIAQEDGTLSAPLRMYVNSANAAQDRSFDKGKVMNPTDVTVDLYDGSITRYPFDKFKADLLIGATAELPKAAEPKKEDGAAEEGAATEAAPAAAPAAPEAKPELETVSVPVAISFFGGLHGLTIKTASTSDEDGYAEIEFKVSRSRTTLAIAWFAMLLLLSMAAAVLLLTLTIVIGGRKLEFPFIGLLGALLFGFVAFRNMLPSTPPVGAMSDYIAFFWAEGIVAACLFTLVATYIKRTLRPAP